MQCDHNYDNIPPNHLLVEQWYYHSDGSKITLLPWPWQYHSGGSKKSCIVQKAQNCQIHSEMEEKNFTATTMVLPRPGKQCNFTSVTVVLPRCYQQMIWRNSTHYFLCHLLVCTYVIIHYLIELVPNHEQLYYFKKDTTIVKLLN